MKSYEFKKSTKGLVSGYVQVHRLLYRLGQEEWQLTFSTMFTLMRLIFTPFIVHAMIQQVWVTAFWLFVFAAITDVIDGWLARTFNERTFLGSCLDPLADKILLISCFTTLAFISTPLFVIPRWFVWMVLSRELLLVGGFAWLAYSRELISVQPSLLGKMTTCTQVMFIIWLFFCYFFHWVPVKTYYLMLSVVSALVIVSGIQYANDGWRYKRQRK